MSRPCRDCGEPIDWEKLGGRNVPVTPGTKNDHREVCLAKRGQVREGLRRPQGHHLSASRIKRHEECPQAFYLESILRLPGATSDDMDAGKLAHDALEGVLVERARSGRLAEPVTAEELHAALEVATLRQPWTGETLAHVREVLAKAAPKLDLSFAERDEHGPLVERAWTHPVGEGVLVGGIWDLVERIDSVIVVRDWKTGGFREPSPASLPAVGLYAAAARARWPGLEVRVVLSYLALGEEDEIAGHALDAAVGHAVALARALALKARAKREDESAWPGVYGPHCSRCPFTARCETFKARSGAALVAADARAWRPVESLTLEEVAAELHTLAAPANVLESRVKALRKRGLELAKPIAETDPWGRVQAGVWPLRVKAITRKAEAAPRAGGTYHVLDVGEPVGRVLEAQPTERAAVAALPAPGAPAPEAASPSATAGAPAVEALPAPGPAEALTPPEPAPGKGALPCGHAPADVETSREGTSFCRACASIAVESALIADAEHAAAVAAAEALTHEQRLVRAEAEARDREEARPREANPSRFSKGSDPAYVAAPSAATLRDPLTDPRAGDVLRREDDGVWAKVVAVKPAGRGVAVYVAHARGQEAFVASDGGPAVARGERMPLTEWRRASRGAVVVRRAEDVVPTEVPSALATVAAGPGAQALAEPLRALGAAAVIAEPEGTAEERAQAEREDAEERAAIRQADGLAPDGTGPGLPPVEAPGFVWDDAKGVR